VSFTVNRSLGVEVYSSADRIAAEKPTIALIVLIARGTQTPARDAGGPAVRLLEERYARGEITREEFLERRAVLDGTFPDAPQ
jgi:hypothetical protein